MSTDFSSLLPALSKVLEAVGSGSIQLEVALTKPDEVKELQFRIAELEAEVEKERAIRHRAELLYSSEVIICSELIDLCREHGIQVRPSMMERPKG